MPFRVERLKETREKLGLSQRELARQCGLSPVLIYRYEGGITVPTTPVLIKIAEKLDVSLDYLAGLTDNPHGQIGDDRSDPEEAELVKAYRRGGWQGVARLSLERLSK